MSKHAIRIYDSKGRLWHREEGTEADLRDLGELVTTVRGQLSWKCDLFRDGQQVGTCKRGVWEEVRP